MQGQRGEDYSRYTSDKSVSPVISSDPSCGRSRWQAGVAVGGVKESPSCVCSNEDETMRRQIPRDTLKPAHL